MNDRWFYAQCLQKFDIFNFFFFLIFFIFPRTWNEACKRQVLVFNGGHGDSLPIIYHDDDDEATRTRCDFNGCSLSGITNASRFWFSRLFHVMNLRRSRLSSLFLSFIIVPFVSYTGYIRKRITNLQKFLVHSIKNQ